MGKRKDERFCEICGNKLNSSQKRFCSKGCMGKWFSSDANPISIVKTKKCLSCGNEFKGWIPDQKFCSSKCYGKSLATGMGNKRKSIVKKTCLNCKKEFVVWNYQKESAKFCSVKCHNQYGRDVIVCPNCLIQFSSPKYEKRKFCSYKCFSEYGELYSVSKFEIEIFEYLNKKLGGNVDSNFIVKYDSGFFKVDIFYNNKVIECYGDYWHCNPSKYDCDYYHSKLGMTAKEKWSLDVERKAIIEKSGMSVFVIWENEYYNDSEGVLKKCLNYLLQK